MPTKRKAPIDTPSAEQTNGDDFTAFDSDAAEESGSSEEEDHEAEPEMSAETRAELLKGFGSDSESSDDEDAQNDEDTRIIELSNLTPNINTALSKKKQKTDESGVLYIGRIPHGFYEEEMTSYFSQFGTILNLRMSRSKKTGRSRHYGFIEFADRGVAEIVAQTMHNYLLAAHLLQVILLTPEEYRKKGGKELFKGAGKKFKAVPWSQIAKDRLESPKTKEQWHELEQRERKRREQAAKRIKAAGIDYEYESPATKRLKTLDEPKSIKSKKEITASAKVTRTTSSVKAATKGRQISSGNATRKVSVK